MLHGVHCLLVVALVTLPLYPIELLKRVWWIPVLLPMVWFLNNNNCPITDKTHGGNDSEFFLDYARCLCPEISGREADSFSFLVILLVVVLSAVRIIRQYEKETVTPRQQ